MNNLGVHPTPMKWDIFVQFLNAKGFRCDASTAGSSVRFDPPNPNDHPISIHKPHPDSTLTPVMLLKLAKRFRRYYGWDEAEFITKANGAVDAVAQTNASTSSA